MSYGQINLYLSVYEKKNTDAGTNVPPGLLPLYLPLLILERFFYSKDVIAHGEANPSRT